MAKKKTDPQSYTKPDQVQIRGDQIYSHVQKQVGSPPPNRVHLDLAPYRYIEYDNPLDLRDRLMKELDAWFANG